MIKSPKLNDGSDWCWKHGKWYYGPQCPECKEEKK